MLKIIIFFKLNRFLGITLKFLELFLLLLLLQPSLGLVFEVGNFLLLLDHILNGTFAAKNMALGAAHGLHYHITAYGAHLEFLDGVLPDA